MRLKISGSPGKKGNDMPARRVPMIPIVCGLVLAFAGTACHFGLTPVADPEHSRTLTTYSYIEEGKLVVFVVDTEAARYRLDEPFVPLYIGIANRTVTPALRISRESFFLVDEEKEVPVTYFLIVATKRPGPLAAVSARRRR